MRNIRQHRQAGGFGLLEMMLVLAILALLTTLAAPSWRAFMASQHHSIAVNELMAALRFTRSEAVKSGLRTTVCTRVGTAIECDGNSWSDGWLIFIDSNNNGSREADEKLLRQHEALNFNVSATGNLRVRKYISYTPLGVTRRANGKRTTGSLQLGTLSICTRGFDRGDKLVINRAGRVSKRSKKNC